LASAADIDELLVKNASSPDPEIRTRIARILKAPQWGEADQGLRVALRPQKREWKAGEPPRLLADISNTGDQSFTVFRHEQLMTWELQVDGQWYTWSGPVAQPPLPEVLGNRLARRQQPEGMWLVPQRLGCRQACKQVRRVLDPDVGGIRHGQIEQRPLPAARARKRPCKSIGRKIGRNSSGKAHGDRSPSKEAYGQHATGKTERKAKAIERLDRLAVRSYSSRSWRVCATGAC
jgi:hypothetical protein